MELTVEVLNITQAANESPFINEQTAAYLDVHSSDRIKISLSQDKEVIAMANIAANFPHNRIGLYKETAQALGVKGDETVKCSWLRCLNPSLTSVQNSVENDCENKT